MKQKLIEGNRLNLMTIPQTHNVLDKAGVVCRAAVLGQSRVELNRRMAMIGPKKPDLDIKSNKMQKRFRCHLYTVTGNPA